jgi:hypothetical protein
VDLPRRAEGQYIVFVCIKCGGVWGTAIPMLASLVFVIAARSYLNLDIHVHHKTHKNKNKTL